MTGYSFTYKAIKYAYYSSELINILTEGGMMAVLAPLLEQLKLFGVTGPTALVRLYYLGCDHTLGVKTDRSPRYREYLPHCSGVLLPHCPSEVLQYVKVPCSVLGMTAAVVTASGSSFCHRGTYPRHSGSTVRTCPHRTTTSSGATGTCRS